MTAADGDMSRSFNIPEHVIARELDGEMVLLNLDSGSYFGLNTVGSMIWGHLVEGDSLTATHTALAQQFEVDEDVLKRDMLELVDSLMRSKLIEARN